MKRQNTRLRTATPLLSLILILLTAASVLPLTANAAEKGKTVRVGWYESPFNITDENGRCSGYAYEYQRKIAAYTGWNYEYVEGSWPDLMQMLIDGEIDLMSDVSYTEDRAEKMLYPELSMGSEEYYLFIDKNNKEIDPSDYTTLNGKKIGANKGSVQIGFFNDWAKTHGIKAEIVELTCETEEFRRMLQNGQIDVWLALDSYSEPETTVPVCWVGSSDFYFAVNKNRPDLLRELNNALTDIRNEDKYYSNKLVEKYTKTFSANLQLTVIERIWLRSHDNTIRVGYLDNYLAFCAADEKGELTGALKDYLKLAADYLGLEQLKFEPVKYPTAASAMQAVENGEIDCMFPANLTAYEAESMGITMTPMVTSTEVYAVVRSADQKAFLNKEDITAAINQENTNYDLFLADHFPGWRSATFKDTATCLEKVADQTADCVLISNYRFNSISKQCKRLKLTTIPTGVTVDFSFAVRDGNTEVYRLLARANKLIPDSSVSAALNYYSTEEARTTLMDLIRDNPAVVILVIVTVAAMILLLIFQRRIIVEQRKANESRQIAADLHEKVFVDVLTRVKNKGAFDNYMRRLQEQLDRHEVTEVAIGVFDCNDLKLINDRYGHNNGNIYLQESCALICRVFQHSPVFRIGGDEFSVILMHEDYKNREELVKRFEKEQEEQTAEGKERWELVRVAKGIAQFDPQLDQSLNDTFSRADQLMYENKRFLKEST